MVKFSVVAKERTKDVRGNPCMLVRLQALAADGFGSDAPNAPAPRGEIVMVVTDREAARFSIDDPFTLRELGAKTTVEGR